MESFIHLHTHSQYSMMRGTAKLETLCKAVLNRGMDTLTVTETNGLYGLIFFQQIAEETGVRPIFGAEISTGEERAVLLVQTSEGYANLCRMLTLRHTAEEFVLSSELQNYSTGLAVLSDSRTVLNTMKGRPHVYAELIGGRNWRPVLQFARENTIPPVATNAVHFLDPDDYELHQLMRAIDLNAKLSRLPERETAPSSAWLKNPSQMRDAFPNVVDALENTIRIAETCQWRHPCQSTLDAGFEGMDSSTVIDTLRKKCERGAIRRYGSVTPEVQKRLDHELQIIGDKGFGSVFLMVEDIVRQSPRTCGRGSAAASIVSYTLGITHVDPLRHNLFFERFLNPGRIDPPDIDVDFAWDERDDILDYVFEKYGPERSAMVANHVGFRLRAAVREVAKVHGLPENEIKLVTDRLSHLWSWGTVSIEDVIASHPLFKGMTLNPPWPEILRQAQRMQGAFRYLSVHCGGVVIVPDKLSNHVPVEIAPKGVQIVQWEKDQTEDSGLIKIDLLGNRSLAVIRDALAAIHKNTGEVIQYADLNPIDDPDTQDLICKGDTLGVFYVESPATRQLQKKAGTGDYEHLVIHSSIIRPAANTYINAYVRRLRGEPWEPLHPVLGDILKDTYGIMVYQEDVTRVAMALAGFSAEEGDGLRKSLSKKRGGQKLKAYRKRFAAGARARGVFPETIQNIWEMILSFSGYSFCKPHSASYALVSFKSAWLRRHYPAEFMAAVISNRGGYYSTFAYLTESRRMGLVLLPPDINGSREPYIGCGQSIRIGLMQLKGLKASALDAILQNRETHGPFCSLDELQRRIAIDPSDLRILIKAGCFDRISQGKSRAELLWQVMAGRRPKKESVQTSLNLFQEEAVRVPELGRYDFHTLLLHEVEVLGFPISVHPLELYREGLRGLNYVPANQMSNHIGKKVAMIGWWVTNKLVYTKTEEPMSFISFEDTTALYETIFFPDAFHRFCRHWTQSRPYILYGTIEDDLGALSLHVTDMAFLDAREKQRKKIQNYKRIAG
ncbi:DNA polymerase III subunit alpha [candidate division KSB1 bacterium]|nr:DNA polymerase III subunit alpha [candidate division KSB1 bacterium]